MEYAPGGDLFQHVVTRKPCPWLPEGDARWLFQQLLIGVDYCHKQVCASIRRFYGSESAHQAQIQNSALQLFAFRTRGSCHNA